MLYAEIKKNCRRAAQRSYHLDEKGKFVPFEVELNSTGVANGEGVVKGGIGGNYHLNEVILYVKNSSGNFVKIQ